MGNGEQRPLDCISTSDCPNNAPAKNLKLLAPKALASAPDGAIYIADYNLIRRIAPDGEISNLLLLK